MLIKLWAPWRGKPRQGLFVNLGWKITYKRHSCQPLLRVNLSPEFVNLYFPYVGQGLLLFRWWQQRFEFQLACVAVEGKSSDVQNTHAQLKISLLMRFLSLLLQASQCASGNGVCRLLVQQFFSLFAQFYTTTKSHETYVFLYPFSNMAISPQNNGVKKYFIQVNCMG